MLITPQVTNFFQVGLKIFQQSQLINCKSQFYRRFIDAAFGVPSSRTYSYSSASMKEKLSYLALQEATDKAKKTQVFSHTLANTLSSFHIEEKTSHGQTWNDLRKHLLSHHNYTLPPFDPANDTNNLRELLGLFQKPLVKGSQIKANPSLVDFVLTPSEVFWGLTPDITVPFTTGEAALKTDLIEIQDILDQTLETEALPTTFESETDNKVQSYALLNCSRDATAATLLATPHLDDTTLLYEMGCWHGQNLLNLLTYASLKGKAPKQCVGIDINARALTMAQSVSSMLGFNEPYLQFHLSNALYPLSSSFVCQNVEKEVRLALRIIPVLEPNRAKIFLQNTRKELKSKKDIMIVSFPLPEGQKYEENKQRAGKPLFKKEDFTGGVVFFQDFTPLDNLPPYLKERSNCDAVLNAYYTMDGFQKLVNDSGFSIDHSILVQDPDNKRMTVQLRPN